MHFSLQTVKHVISSDLVGTAGGNDTKTFDVEFPIPEVPSSHVDTSGIGIGYFIQVEVDINKNMINFQFKKTLF